MYIETTLQCGAATSAAAKEGVITNDILRAADWSNESVFSKILPQT